MWVFIYKIVLLALPIYYASAAQSKKTRVFASLAAASVILAGWIAGDSMYRSSWDDQFNLFLELSVMEIDCGRAKELRETYADFARGFAPPHLVGPSTYILRKMIVGRTGNKD